ncbi:type II toxin-antitoxin system PemK/MazF family toxin [Raineyella antarctica]|nr:type II toxin-antitoxin system PemK/MazF family toxin [Raineyella antarctica]
MAAWKQIIGNALRKAVEEAVRTSLQRAGSSGSQPRSQPRSKQGHASAPHTSAPRTSAPRPSAPHTSEHRTPQPGGYPGDFTGRPTLTYAPREDGRPDPGEVVWTWVPYEEDHSRGKDRPVLLIGSDGPWLLGLQLTSQDHDRDAAQEASAGRYWMDIGTGTWDREGRASEVRLNRIIRIDPDAVRRTAARLDQGRFTAVARGVERYY